MIITKQVTALTINTLDALIANFATGIISLDELWEAIECAEDVAYFRDKLKKFPSTPLEQPNPFFDLWNRSIDADTGSGI